MYRDQDGGDRPGEGIISSVEGPISSLPVGKIQKITGSFTIERAGSIVAQPVVGGFVYCGDVVETQADGLVEILFIDGTTFHLFAGARAVVDEFSYRTDKSTNSALLRVVKGMFGYFAGQVAVKGRL